MPQNDRRRPHLLSHQETARLRRSLQPHKPAPLITIPRLIGAVILLLALLLIAVGAATAHEFTRKDITVAHPWARATPGGVSVGGAYLEIKAAPGKGDRLIGGKSPVAGSIEIHSHIVESGVARMRRVEALTVKGGASVVLKPGGYHVMLMDLKQPLKEGDLLKLILQFERAGDVEVEATVEPVGAKGPHGFDSQPVTDKPSGGHKAH